MHHEDDPDANYSTQTPGKLRISAQAILTIVGWLVTVMLAYGAVNARVAVLESKQNDNDRRLQRIEDKVDLLLQRTH